MWQISNFMTKLEVFLDMFNCILYMLDNETRIYSYSGLVLRLFDYDNIVILMLKHCSLLQNFQRSNIIKN